MSFQLEQKPFLPVNPPEVARDMTEESVSRQIGAPVHTYLYFIIASLTICLLATLGTILVLVLQQTGSTAQCGRRSAEVEGKQAIKRGSVWPGAFAAVWQASVGLPLQWLAEEEEESPPLLLRKLSGFVSPCGRVGLVPSEPPLVPISDTRPEPREGMHQVQALLSWLIQSEEALKFEESPTAPKKAAAYLQVLTPVNQSQLKWMRDSILYNMKYNDGNLVIQIPGMYFVYCHLYFYVAQCESDEMDVKVKLLHGKKILKESVVTLCSSQQKSGGLTHDRFLGLLVHLEKGDQISVEIDPFNHLETNIFPKNNVLGAFRYDGEDWGCSFLKAVNG
ncbi:Tumor necrosis factor ligand superfamily member 8 [Varanus komodoensis]|nr:Tumor necrosis factor ligand superfamily member 8 [Varanus komodoensis]